LYAPMNESYLRELGADSVIGGEFEEGVTGVYRQVMAKGHDPFEQPLPTISLRRQDFLVPDRAGLPGLDSYARLQMSPNDARITGYTEASRGCRHLCRHCPVVPVYNGRFVVVQPDVVLEDVRRQVAAGAQHITFGDPDFFNGPQHALRVVRQMHDEFPSLTYDVTIKVEHLRKHADLLPGLKATGCVLVTSAIESFDDEILARFDKSHTYDDLEAVIDTLRDFDLALNPTFVTFTPWTTPDGYIDFLATLARLNLVSAMSSVQYAIRLLVPANSKLLELDEVCDLVAPFDEVELAHPWKHPDPAVDRLFEDVVEAVQRCQKAGLGHIETFNAVWDTAHAARGVEAAPLVDPRTADVEPLAAIPYLTEPWYC
ncbi:MAG: radical SAM protein, partial [Actinomycetota bacterium]